MLRQFIETEIRHTSHPKYYKYIDEYINNMTTHQLEYWKAWMKGKKNPY